MRRRREDPVCAITTTLCQEYRLERDYRQRRCLEAILAAIREAIQGVIRGAILGAIQEFTLGAIMQVILEVILEVIRIRARSSSRRQPFSPIKSTTKPIESNTEIVALRI